MAVCGGQRRPPRSDESQMLMVDLSHVQTTFFCSRVSLLLDLTAHLAAFIPLTAFDLLSMSRLFIAGFGKVSLGRWKLTLGISPLPLLCAASCRAGSGQDSRVVRCQRAEVKRGLGSGDSKEINTSQTSLRKTGGTQRVAGMRKSAVGATPAAGMLHTWAGGDALGGGEKTQKWEKGRDTVTQNRLYVSVHSGTNG